MTRKAVVALLAAFLASGSIRVLTPRLGAAPSMLAGYGALAVFLAVTWSAADSHRLARPSARLLLAGLGWGLVLFLVGGVAYALTGAAGLDTGPPQLQSRVDAWLLPGVVLAAVTEELLFRGRIQAAAEQHVPVGGAVVLQSALFALYHLSPGQLLATFAYGLLLGLATTRRGGLTLALAAHVTLNVIGLSVFVVSSWE